ncbi:receptor protein kinase TMK1-like [Typha latifolia]|uniref:receptor protein kinase TMK1-like n=1 Tax=Typha latifolia TaxID=4733 RepID=UPI003C30150B
MRVLARSLGADTILGWFGSDPCSPSPWPGVMCSAEGRVTEILAGNCSLKGSLSADLRNLTALTVLDLRSNSLTGPLPSLSGLSSLQALFLHSNLFSSVPLDFFSGLSSLSSVSLDGNPFEPWPIPPSLADANHLVNFSANSANVSGLLPEFLATAFPSLARLDLSFNLLFGPVPAGFAPASLRQLLLNNQRGNAHLSGSIEFVANLSSLEQLWLQFNDFSGPLPNFSLLTSLYDLRLGSNKLTGPVPQSLIEVKSLKEVSLSNNFLQGPVPVFPSSVEEVDLVPHSERFCLLTPGKCDPRVNVLLSIIESFGYPLKFAESWSGNDPCNNWSGISCNARGNITVINFQRMRLNGTISPKFASISSLKQLILSNNNLTGNIPSTLASLPLLEKLDVANNSLYGEVPNFSEKVTVITDGNPDMEMLPSSAYAVVLVFVIVAVVAVVFLFELLWLSSAAQEQHYVSVERPSTNKIEMMSMSPTGAHAAEGDNMVFSIESLRTATDDFSRENVLGCGGFGVVYKGVLPADGTRIAVKRMEASVVPQGGFAEFEAEIAVLTKVRHRSLVSLLGYCTDGDERLLVYEYMSQGSLSEHLFNWREQGLEPLDWKRRMNIALDVARGIEYLHSLANQSFIHRDLKSSNILLGDDMRAKVADFGLARLVPDGGSLMTKFAGTFGYLAPEIAQTALVTTKCDVYSFGAILMELITGQKVINPRLREGTNLVSWFRKNWRKEDELKNAIDSSFNLDDGTLDNIKITAELAVECCAKDYNHRPDMGQAVNVLSRIVEQWSPSSHIFESSGDMYHASLMDALAERISISSKRSSFSFRNTQSAVLQTGEASHSAQQMEGS